MDNHDFATLNHQLTAIAHRVRHALDAHDYPLAKRILTEQGLKLLPNHPIMLSDLAYAESQLGRYKEAYDYLQKALTHYDNTPYRPDQPKYTIYDTLVSVCGQLNRNEEAYFYAKKSMADKKKSALQHKPLPLPLPTLPHKGLHPDKSKNIIAYSLFGANPRYCEVAVINATLAPHIYPEWTCRFYVDDSVPGHVLRRLAQYHAQIIKVNRKELGFSGLFWRFLVLADENVHCFIIRDADSLLSYKERYAVDEWLNSGKFFHIMRDDVCHNELILAGMWGGYTGAFPSIKEDMQVYFGSLTVLNKTIDQQFLRNHIWVTVNQSVLVHDKVRLEKDSLPYPDYPLSDIEKIPYFHIGMVDARAKAVIAEVTNSDAKRVQWQLVNQHNHPICSYEADVITQNNRRIIKLYLPYFYTQKIEHEHWQIQTKTLA
ncbi:MAG: tetratricopeptide repeat protein [Moraxella sp.]|uniref:tetratricopeptide repeat protein n=1 Tax=Moraxella sp. TaxID=479 RepID=UPI0026DDC3C6|nr:tetratricopeptide repeat protein [Moraxella sp.]MDO4450173.1 tetratricopeptide repeat protein [Moraxella sp.]